MLKYTIKRILLLIPIIVAVVFMVFTIMYFAPGDPAEIALGPSATPEQIAAKQEELGLNGSYFERLGKYMYQVFFEFDLGNSYVSGASIAGELISRFPRTLMLAALTIVVALVTGVLLGVNAAVNRNKLADYTSMILALIGNSMPNFWIALMLVLVFAYKFKLLPAYGMEGFEYWILPVIANAFGGMGSIARQTRSSMLEVIGSDYIVMAKAKGLTGREVIFKHALPNALIPVITVAGTTFGRLLGGSLIIERVFNIPGVGNYLVNAVNNRDYIVILGGVILLAICFSIIMLLTDLLMAIVDPRIKTQFMGTRIRKVAKTADD